MMSSANNVSNERQSSENKSISPSSSPRGSPRLSPRSQIVKEHSSSPDTHLTVNYQQPFKHEGSPSDGSVSSKSNVESSPNVNELKTENLTNSGKEKKEGRNKKKSSWFNSFYPTYKSRSEDFKRLFKNVPDDERLVVDYSCALQKEILVHGRLYITQNYLCFYANIFGWETNVTLKWKEVAAITKEKTALVIPNAVLICTRSDKYFFTSFAARDKTYLMIFRVWQNALMDQQMSVQEMWQLVHQCYGDELGLTSDDEDYIAPGTEDDKLSSRLSESFFEQESTAGDFADMDPMFCEKSDVETKAVPWRSASDSHIPADMTDNSESDIDKPLNIDFDKGKRGFNYGHKKTHSYNEATDAEDAPQALNNPTTDERIKCISMHQGRELMNEIYPIHIDQLFTLLFTSSKFYLDFHAARKTTDLTQTPWTHNPLDNSKSRVVNLTIALNQAMGPKSAQVTETQVMLPCSKAGCLYAIDIESINGGVPYADSFFVIVHYCLQKLSENQTSIKVFGQVKYKKSVWGLVKGMIERNCWSGLDDFFASLNKALLAEGEDNFSDVKRKSRRKRRIHSMPRSGIENPSTNAIERKRHLQPRSILNSDVSTMIVFSVLLVLLIVNIMLYYKLWSLEKMPTYTILDFDLIQNPPKSHEEWIRLLQDQETLHSTELKKWQKILKSSIELLRQVEESLNQLQHFIHPVYTQKIMAARQGSKENVEEL